MIRRCEMCQKYNRKGNNKGEFATPTRFPKKVTIDLIDIGRKAVLQF